MNVVALIFVPLAFGPSSIASTVNATVVGWPSDSIICVLFTASMAQLYNARFVRVRLGLDTRSTHTKDLKNWYMLFPYLVLSTLEKGIGDKHFFW